MGIAKLETIIQHHRFVQKAGGQFHIVYYEGKHRLHFATEQSRQS
jgi:hypothetical protein